MTRAASRSTPSRRGARGARVDVAGLDGAGRGRAAPAVPTRVALLALARRRRARRRSRCTSTTACGPGATREADAWSRASPRGSAPAFACARGARSSPGRNLEARARDARVRRARRARGVELGASTSCSSATPPTTRPRRCCSTCCAARAAAGLAGMAPRHAASSCDRCSRSAAPTRARVCAALGARPVLDDPMNDDRAFRRVAVRHEVLPLLGEVAGRDLVPVLARQADVLRAESEYLDELAVAAWPGADRRRARARSRALPPAARPARGPVAGSARRRRRVAEVERVLAVARGRARARPSSPAGAACAASGGRLVVDAASVHGPWTSTPTIGRIVVGEDELQRPHRRARQGDHRRLRGPPAAARRRAQGRVRVHERPRRARSTCRSSSTSWRCRRTARRPARAVSCAS